MRYKTGHAEETRARIREAAARELRAKGPYRLGVATVMASAGLTHGGFFRHFGSKDELILEAIDQIFLEAKRMFDRHTRGKSARVGLASFLDWYLSREHSDAVDDGCPMPFIASEVWRLSPDARLRFEAGYAGAVRRVALLIRKLDHPEPGELAVSVYAELTGAVIIARSLSDPTSRDALLGSVRRRLGERLGLDGARQDHSASSA